MKPPPNNPINPTVVPVTRLACARRAPVPPAGYRVRWADPVMSNAITSNHVESPRKLGARNRVVFGWALTGIAVAFYATACSRNPGDGRESVGDKKEWSILQTVELEGRNRALEGMEFRTIEGYDLVCVAREGDSRRIWIMLNPRHAPLYKQLPQGNFSLSVAELEELSRRTRLTSTVRQALASHLEAR